jgi:hypothetical protein
MTTAKKCRELAAECLRWAAEAPTDKVQRIFLQMGSDLMAAALRAEGVLEPSNDKELKGSSAA